MIHLSINTAVEPYGIGIFDDEKFLSGSIWSFSESEKNIHFLLLDSLLKSLSISDKEFKFITVVGGPGSFTGLRIGFTIAKTIGFVRKIPIVVPSTFEILKRVTKIEGAFILNAGLGEVFVFEEDSVKILKFNDLRKIKKILIFPERNLFLKIGKGINLPIPIDEVGKIGFYKYNKREVVDFKDAIPYYMRNTSSIFKPFKEES